ncbi:helix-turn-helix domain-containing protein [Cohnella rhizosphaerae]|uniref:Helix-turn-helix domain-containing protein n=1 Tax=Cohnella rhizosphaerae TaxID=1457232 RepID=A0A9X4QRA8_9BACL|nr:helix-turn-helix domain-containing protein [Cohnella rhizosphaerae]MDG0808049.1 helix-turn-helix domain-containing protein [Cohnella rhizosphaerae]
MGWIRSRMFSRMFFSFTVALVTIILGLSYGLFVVFERVALRIVTESNMKTLSQISYSANYMNDNARNFAISIFGDPDLTQMMYRSDEDGTSLLFNMDRLKQLTATNPFIYSFHVYNSRIDRLFTIGDTAQDTPENRREIDRIMQSADQNRRKLLPIPRRVRLDPAVAGADTPVVNVYTYLMYDLISGKSGPEGAIIVNVKEEYLNDLIHSLQRKNSFPGMDTFIVDGDGTFVSGGKAFLTQTEDSFVRTLLQSGQTDGHFLSEIDGEKKMVAYVSSELLGWKFISVVPYTAITDEASRIKRITLFVCAALLVLGAGASFLISSTITSPLRKLVGKLKHSAGDPAEDESLDEISLLSRAIAESTNKARLLDAAERDKLHALRNELLADLLLGGKPAADEGERLQTTFRRYGVKLDVGDDYMLVAWRLDRYAAFASAYSLRDQALLRFAFANAADELLRTSFDSETVYMGGDTLISIVQAAGTGPDESPRKLGGIIAEIQSWTLASLKLSVSASTGYVHRDFGRLGEAYREVTRIAQYRLIFGHGSVLRPDSLKAQSTDAYRLPVMKEKRLLEALRTGKLNEADMAYTDIVGEIRGYSYDTVVSTLLYVTYAIYNELHQLESNSQLRFDIDFTTFNREIGELETLEQIGVRFASLFRHVAGIVSEQKPKRGSAVTETIVQLIDQNYKDKSLCLESIASTVNMSKVYIGKLFREAYNQSVADYITDVRLKRVVALLHSGVINVGDILDEVGLENSNYFYKLFKARMGISFSEYKTRHLPQLITGHQS